MAHKRYQFRFGIIISLIIATGFLLTGLSRSSALQQSEVVIFALQTASAQSAGDEVIVLFNRSDQPISLTGWELQYQSTAGTTWSTKARLTGVIMPRVYYIVATSNAWPGEVDDALTSSMAGGGGHMRLIQSQTSGLVVMDLVGWGTAQHADGQPAPAPAAGTFIIRVTDADDMPVDTDNNAADFTEQSQLPELIAEEVLPTEAVPDPTPTEAVDVVTDGPSLPSPEDTTPELLPVQPTVLPTPDPLEIETPPAETAVTTTAPNGEGIIITELLPNPALPDVDSQAEFVEIYNASDSTLSLQGYTLLSGSNLTYSAELSGVILPHAYMVLYAAHTRMTLGNSTGRVELRKSSSVIDTVPVYGVAAEGVAWALINGSWQWTQSPTPGAQNVLTVAEVKQATTASAPKSSPTPKSKPTATKAPAKATKTSTAKTAAKTTKTTESSNGVAQEVYQEPASQTGRNVVLLASVGGIAILYGLYEYRQDLAHHYHRLKRYYTTRRGSRRSFTRR